MDGRDGGRGWVYVMTNRSHEGEVKVGFTMKMPEERAQEMNGPGNPFDFKVAYKALVDDAYRVERETHVRLAAFRVKKEWFGCTPRQASEAIGKCAPVIHFEEGLGPDEGMGSTEALHRGLDLREGGLYEEALVWFRRAHGKGERDAAYWIGMAHSTGQGVERDDGEAFRWFVIGAEKGDEHSMYRTGLAFLKGSGIQADRLAAARWFEAAALRGHPSAMRRTGESLMDGVPRRDAKGAVEWFERAAGRGDRRSMLLLGMALKNGYGSSEDKASAIAWFKKAAGLGDKESMLMMGRACLSGEGVAADVEQASRWFEMARSVEAGR